MTLSSVVFSQGIKDSVFMLKTVQVNAERSFSKDKAGMKETSIDTIVLLDKVNLSLSELLSENTPVFIKNHGRGALASASFRGTASSHTQVTWNGMNINSPMVGMVDFSLIPVYIIDGLNLKYGAASIADQGGGLGGSVSISNNVNWQRKSLFKYIQGIGSYNTFDEFLQFGFGNNKLRSKTRVYHNYSKNDYTFINRGIGNIDPETGEIINPIDTNHNADFKRYGFLQEIYFKPNTNNIVSARWWWQKAKRAIPRATSYEGPDNSNLNSQIDNDNRIVIDWKRFGEKNMFILRSGFARKDLTYSLKNHVYGMGEVPVVFSESNQNSTFNTVSYTLNSNKDFSLESSIDFNYHDVHSKDTVKKTGYSKQRFELSVLFTVRKSFVDRLNLNLIFRQNWTDFNVQPLIPCFGFDYKLIKGKNLILKGNIARNYHQPSLNDMYWQPGGNPNLKPEKGFGFELGLEYQKDIENHNFKAEITAFRSDIDNWILWIPSYKGYWEPRNINRVLSQGLEVYLFLNGSIAKLNYKIAANYTYTSSKNYGDAVTWGDQSYGKQLVYVPLHSGNLMINISYRKFYFTYQHNSYSERNTTSSNDITKRDWLYPYFMNDLIIGKDFLIGNLSLTAEFKIYNLFNETYHSVLYRPMPGRNYMLMIMVKI